MRGSPMARNPMPDVRGSGRPRRDCSNKQTFRHLFPPGNPLPDVRRTEGQLLRDGLLRTATIRLHPFFWAETEKKSEGGSSVRHISLQASCGLGAGAGSGKSGHEETARFFDSLRRGPHIRSTQRPQVDPHKQGRIEGWRASFPCHRPLGRDEDATRRHDAQDLELGCGPVRGKASGDAGRVAARRRPFDRAVGHECRYVAPSPPEFP